MTDTEKNLQAIAEFGEAQNAAVQTAQELLACNLTMDNQAAEIGRLKAELEAALKDRVAPAVQVEPAGWMTHHDEPMLFATEIEAAEYCEDDERPIPLYTASKAKS